MATPDIELYRSPEWEEQPPTRTAKPDATTRPQKTKGRERPPTHQPADAGKELCSDFIRHHMGELGHSELKVWLVLWESANADGIAWPSRRTIADRVNVSVKTVSRACQRLIELGLLTVDRQGGIRKGGTNPTTTRYRVDYRTRENAEFLGDTLSDPSQNR